MSDEKTTETGKTGQDSNSELNLLLYANDVQMDPDFIMGSMVALHGMLIDAGVVRLEDKISGKQALHLAQEYLQKKGI